MYKNKTIAVVIPCHNEEKLITRVLETMPHFVDRVFVVDDVSDDKTLSVARDWVASHDAQRVTVIAHEKNRGVGGAIKTGYKESLKENIDITSVMAGDAQMDPEELPKLLDAVIERNVDYAKGDRLQSGDAWDMIPKTRYLGNAMLSFLTKIASGYWHVADSQTGYTAITREALKTIPLDKMYERYGYPNHLLILLSVYNFKVRDIPIKAIYNIGEKSGIRIGKVVFTISWLLFKQFIYRIIAKYVIRDSHPLVLCYALSFLLSVIAFLCGGRMFFLWILNNHVPPMNPVIFLFASITGLQFLFFAMWMDMEYTKSGRWKY